ncbi:hypothetical protein ACHAPT_010527, partial [Fusarium lateritium]
MPESSDYPKRPVLIDIESGFSLSAGRFKVNAENVALFNPTILRLKHDQERTAEAAEVLSNKEFVAGQLKHYGINFPPTAKLVAIRDILRRAVDQGKAVHDLSKTIGKTSQEDKKRQRKSGRKYQFGQNSANTSQSLDLEQLVGS